MILYLHDFNSTSTDNHQKIRQLQFIDDDVRLISYSTLHPRYDMQHLLNDVTKQCKLSADPQPLILGVGLGGYWAERIGFLAGMNSILINPNLWPEKNMVGLIDRPEEYSDIATKCIADFRQKNTSRALCFLSKNTDKLDSNLSFNLLNKYYKIIWDNNQTHSFTSLAGHLPTIKAFKNKTINLV